MIDKDPIDVPMQNQTPSEPPTGIDPDEPDPDNPKTGRLSGGKDAFSRALGGRRRHRPPTDPADKENEA